MGDFAVELRAKRVLAALSLLACTALIASGSAGAEELQRSAALEASDAMFEDDPLAEEAVGDSDAGVSDPLEGMNRRIFRGNQVVDRVFLDPVARAYRYVVPNPARRAVRGVFQNLGEPGVLVNDLLQGEKERARDAGTRFLLNSTVGIAGVWDPAERLGFEAHSADFGQTLGKAGVDAGPYLVLPLFGPNTARDLVGDVVDLAMRPDTWFVPIGPVGGRIVIGSTDGISIKEENLEAVDALEKTSVDFYTAMRSAYLMNREAAVRRALDSDATSPVAAALEPPRPPPLRAPSRLP